MENIIIIGIVIIMMLIGVRSTIKHFKGESSCCGGGSSEKVTKKRLKNVFGKKIVLIDGMTCEHCKNRVERVLNDFEIKTIYSKNYGFSKIIFENKNHNGGFCLSNFATFNFNGS